MGNELDLIKARRAEVEKEIASLNDEIAVKEKEIENLDIAWNVLVQLSGKVSPVAKTPLTRRQALNNIKKKSKRPKTMPEMILSALTDAQKQFKIGLRPKDIHRHIVSADDPTADIQRVNSVAWRMWKRGEIARDMGWLEDG